MPDRQLQGSEMNPHIFVTDLSLLVLNALWTMTANHSRSPSAGEIRRYLEMRGEKRAIQTIGTVLDRLAAKGYVAKEQIPYYNRAQYRWRPLYSREDMKRLAVQFIKIYVNDPEEVKRLW